MRPDYLTTTFTLFARKAGVRGRAGEPGLRLHDLRHGFSVSAPEGSLSSSRKDIARHMLALSTRQGLHRRRAALSETTVEDDYPERDQTDTMVTCKLVGALCRATCRIQ